jgi:hypothetical protein
MQLPPEDEKATFVTRSGPLEAVVERLISLTRRWVRLMS